LSTVMLMFPPWAWRLRTNLGRDVFGRRAGAHLLLRQEADIGESSLRHVRLAPV